ncbi:MAG TPA: AraC family transcriptional regulator ligand-binding domain-containing protein [Polyangiaceae bacterium]
MAISTSGVPSVTLRAMLEGMSVARLDTRRILRQSGLCHFDLVREGERVPNSAYVKMWREVRRVARDDAVGAVIGAAVPIGMFGVVDYLAASSSTLGESMTSTRDFTHLMIDGSFWELERGSKGELAARFVNVVASEEDDIGDEFAMGLLLARMNAWTYAPVHVVEVQLTRRKPAVSLERQFSGRISYGHATSQFVLGPGSTELPLKPADPCLHATLRALLHEAGQDLGSRTGTAASVRHCARQLLLQASMPAEHTIARRLGLSKRTLQRQLTSEGTTFERVLDELRRDIAQQRLRAQRGPSMIQVALEVGFADERSLARAFHRWTGMSPRQWQAKARMATG